MTGILPELMEHQSFYRVSVLRLRPEGRRYILTNWLASTRDHTHGKEVAARKIHRLSDL